MRLIDADTLHMKNGYSFQRMDTIVTRHTCAGHSHTVSG